MRVSAGILPWLLAIRPAAAHEPVLVAPETLWRSWTFDPLVLVPLLLVLWFYARGLRHLWGRAGRGRGIAYYEVVSFGLGIAVLLIALVSPIDAGERSSTHPRSGASALPWA